ncbi:MAG TPA: thiamine pyrophosphate-dependent enzyme [Conexibacter sp.]
MTVTDSRPLTDWEPAYRALTCGRAFDELALKLQRQGVLDSYGEARGQEAGQIGTTIDLGPEDMVFPSYRQPAVALARGVPVIELLRFYAGADFCPWDWRKHGFAPYCIPVGSQVAHAVGWAWGTRLEGSDAVTVVFFGDGAASQGEVHEAMNYAGVFGAPVIFVLENNGFAISLPTARQTNAPELYVRAAGYGIAGVRVDGNDLVAVRSAAEEALARARAGDGPTLIESVTYRMGGHTTSDDPRRYRAPEELLEWEARDPVIRFRAALAGVPGFEDRAAEIDREVAADLDRATDEFLSERGMA